MKSTNKPIPYEGREPYVFISYSHKDEAAVLTLAERLIREGYRIWYDEGIDPGSEWPRSIAQHLKSAAAVIICVSPNSVASKNCWKELNFAADKDIPMLCVYLTETTLPDEWDLQISTSQAVHRYAYRDEAQFYTKLIGCEILGGLRSGDYSSRLVIQNTAPVGKAVYPEVGGLRISYINLQKRKDGTDLTFWLENHSGVKYCVRPSVRADRRNIYCIHNPCTLDPETAQSYTVKLDGIPAAQELVVSWEVHDRDCKLKDQRTAYLRLDGRTGDGWMSEVYPTMPETFRATKKIDVEKPQNLIYDSDRASGLLTADFYGIECDDKDVCAVFHVSNLTCKTYRVAASFTSRKIEHLIDEFVPGQFGTFRVPLEEKDRALLALLSINLIVDELKEDGRYRAVHDMGFFVDCDIDKNKCRVASNITDWSKIWNSGKK